MSKIPVKILLSGGGSGGSVAPLIAIANQLRKDYPKVHFKFLLVGTPDGPEKQMAELHDIEYTSIPITKFRRYWSLQNFLLPFAFIYACYKALRVLHKYDPHCVVGAGSFVQVPVMYIAKILGKPLLIHQQDVKPGLANVVCAPIADKVTLTFAQSQASFTGSFTLSGLSRAGKFVTTGNPVYIPTHAIDHDKALKQFGFKDDKPVLLVLGGGTGAGGINVIVWKVLKTLLRDFQIIHQTGKGKGVDLPKHQGYFVTEFLDKPEIAYEAADIVLSRAGLSTITELSELKKVSVLIPMPDSHQEINGDVLYKAQAAIVVNQKTLDPHKLANILKQLLFKVDLQKHLKHNIHSLMPHGANEKVAKILLKLIETYHA